MRARRQSERLGVYSPKPTTRLWSKKSRTTTIARRALLEEIYSRDEYLDSIERDLDQMLQTEGKLREEVSSKEKLVSEETIKNDKLCAIEEQAMWTSSLNTKNGRTKKTSIHLLMKHLITTTTLKTIPTAIGLSA